MCQSYSNLKVDIFREHSVHWLSYFNVVTKVCTTYLHGELCMLLIFNVLIKRLSAFILSWLLLSFLVHTAHLSCSVIQNILTTRSFSDNFPPIAENF